MRTKYTFCIRCMRTKFTLCKPWNWMICPISDSLLWTHIGRLTVKQNVCRLIWIVTSNTGDISLYVIFLCFMWFCNVQINYDCPLYFMLLHLIFLKHPLLYSNFFIVIFFLVHLQWNVTKVCIVIFLMFGCLPVETVSIEWCFMEVYTREFYLDL